ncbi:MAG: bifunctional diguanylate cyclase/phosphodiesterase [Actinomycetota bacterium]
MGGNTAELQTQLRRSWIVATLVSPAIGPLGLAVFNDTIIPRSMIIVWGVAQVGLGLATAGALVADRAGRKRVAHTLDIFYRYGIMVLFALLPWMAPAAAGRSPDQYILALTMVVSSAGGTMTVIQFAGRSKRLIIIVLAGNLSYALAYALNANVALFLVSVVWTGVCAAVGTVAAAVHVELIRLRENEEISARHDHLTGLLNRQGLFDELGPNDARGRSLVIIDLDRFKLINDSFGHQCGDYVLMEAARRMERTLPPQTAIGRIGGDEFAAILPSAADPRFLRPLLEEVLRVLEQPIDYEGRNLRIGASIGVTCIDAMSSPSESFAEADLSMYRSKRTSAQPVTFFDNSLREELTARMELEQRFRRGLEDGAVTFWGQCVVRADDLSPVGVELLARWIDADGTMVSPADFIPIAEETGLSVELGRLVLDQAADLLNAWRDDPALAEIEVNVNISPAHLAAGLVGDVVERFPAPDDRLGIEFVETGLISSFKGDHQQLDDLRGTGARLVIDDFGVGYSSLSYLWSLPLDTLKIDKSFIDNVTTDPVRHQVVAAIATMADALEVPCIAEGVENAGTIEAVNRLGIERVQGFAIHRPEPLDGITASIRRLAREAVARREASSAAAELFGPSAQIGSGPHRIEWSQHRAEQR